MKPGERVHPAEWERDRVRRWMEITKADPLTWPRAPHGFRACKGRVEQFEDRYTRLETEVPTP